MAVPKDAPYELLTNPDLFRQNANINSGIIVPLTMLDATNRLMHETADRLGIPHEEQGTVMDAILQPFSEYSRSEAMKGSEQIVRSFMGQQLQDSLEGSTAGPSMKPATPPGAPQTMAVVAYSGAKEWRRDVRRRRWKI